MTKDMSDRIKALGFLMTCVIAVYHCFFYGEAVNSLDLRLNKAVDLTAETIAFVAMCWFFSVSGFLLFRNLTFCRIVFLYTDILLIQFNEITAVSANCQCAVFMNISV